MSGGGQPLKFRTAEIRDRRGCSVALAVAPADLRIGADPELRLAGPVEVALDFSIGGGSILMQARLKGAWIVNCSRCLNKTEAAFEASTDETYPAAVETIDVGSELREAVLLEFPQRWVCRNDCKGFQSKWGEEPSGDLPRKKSPFEVLKKLKKK